MTLQLQDASATTAQTAAFNARFDALPTEIKVEILIQKVTCPCLIPLPLLVHYSQLLCASFSKCDEALVAEACTQFERVNSFSLHSDAFAPLLGRNIRSLTLFSSIAIEGGDTDDPKTFEISNFERATIKALPRRFPQLERVTYRVDNTAAILRGARYWLNGVGWPAQASQGLMTHERMGKMDAIMNLFRNLQSPHWRQSLTSKKRIWFAQWSPGKKVTAMTDMNQMTLNSAYAERAAKLYQIMDAREAIVYYDRDGNVLQWWWV